MQTQPRRLLEKWPFPPQLPNQDLLQDQSESAVQRVFSHLGVERFCALKSGTQEFDWQRDFRSGYLWSSQTPSRQILRQLQPGPDLRFAWELARFHHSVWFALRYRQTGEERWWRAFQKQVLDFLSANPRGFGIHWISAMELGIRLANWILAFELFRLSGAEPEGPFVQTLLDAVREHAEHILDHLEWHDERRTNHYLANLGGMTFAAAFLPTSKQTGLWLDWSSEQLELAVWEQFSRVGANLEGSTSYHRLSAEIAILTTAVLLGQGHQFSTSYLRQLSGMGEFCRDVTRPDGRVYQLGDSDNGRFLPVVPTASFDDHRHLLGILSGLVPEFAEAAGPWSVLGDLTRVLSGGKALQPFQPLDSPHRTGPFSPTPTLSSQWSWEIDLSADRIRKAYHEFGLYIFRGEDFFLAFRCGFVGQMGHGGHSHCDQLSVELFLEGRSVLTEAGTYCYMGDIETRNLYRCTAAHNAPRLEGHEQADLSTDPFKLVHATEGELVAFGEDGVEGRMLCEGGWLHRRIRMEDDKLTIIDWHSQKKSFVGIQELMTGQHQGPVLKVSRGYGVQEEALCVCSGCVRSV